MSPSAPWQRRRWCGGRGRETARRVVYLAPTVTFDTSVVFKEVNCAISALDQQRAARRPMCVCVCVTKRWSVKQRLNLCKQPLAALPNCLPARLPAVWAGAWRGLIPWHGRGSHMLPCVCARACLHVCLCVIMQTTQAEGMKDGTWRQIQRTLTNSWRCQSYQQPDSTAPRR